MDLGTLNVLTIESKPYYVGTIKGPEKNTRSCAQSRLDVRLGALRELSVLLDRLPLLRNELQRRRATLHHTLFDEPAADDGQPRCGSARR